MIAAKTRPVRPCHAVVIGATGFLARHWWKLIASGHDVTAICRRPLMKRSLCACFSCEVEVDGDGYPESRFAEGCVRGSGYCLSLCNFDTPDQQSLSAKLRNRNVPGPDDSCYGSGGPTG